MQEIEQYRIFEAALQVEGPEHELTGTFVNGSYVRIVKGFYDGENSFIVRFMPQLTGEWHYKLSAGDITKEGCFRCIPHSISNHGPVVAEGFGFRYAEGKRFLPFGTTCYAWIHQKKELVRQTLETFKESPFNKVRMCVFPKDMIYNQNDPDLYPFHKKEDGSWDVCQPDILFWRHLEKQIQNLDDLGIEADLVLFHPYDRWGFAALSREDSLVYLEYCVSRLSAYKNVWWSLANEYDLMEGKDQGDWEAFAAAIRKMDSYGHLLSIHHCLSIYPKADWMTHCSVQTRLTQNALALRHQYQIPVIIDECGYEGDIEFNWGNLSAFELVHRIWTAVIRGGYGTHGETFYREDEVLWWAKGGKLYGESIERIRFLKELLEEFPGNLNPITDMGNSDPNGREQAQENPFAKALMKLPEAERNEQIMELIPLILGNDDCRLQYLGRNCPAWLNMMLPMDIKFKIEVIDVWKMTQKVIHEAVSGEVKVNLPAKEGIAVLAVKTCE